MKPKRMAIIGAGACGLVAIKSCLDEGLVPVCFERTEEMGGLWRYTDEPVEGQACVMKSTVINTSKKIMAFSDFPIPAEFPIYMHHFHVHEYFKKYAENFGLLKHINYNIEVMHLKKADNFAVTGKWDVKYRNKKTDEMQHEVFDGVLVCSGHHAEKHLPSFPGLSDFQGKGFEDKRVLIIGIGNSGGDAAVELSRVASQVFLSTRRGTWILNRLSDGGYPVDMSQPMINDDLPNRIICGSVKIKTDIKRFTKTGAEFVDGTAEDKIDTVILATGYIFGFPFIDKEIIDVKENKVQLYKYMYPPDLEYNTLAIIGCFQALGPLMPLAELQCRLATRVINGDCILPTKQKMWEDIRKKETIMAKRYIKTQRHTIQVDFIPFMDELAELVECKVDYWDLVKKDPALAFKVMFDTVTPYTYRLYGPGKWSGAREAIMTQWDRTLAPLKTRPLPETKRCQTKNYLFYLAMILLVFFVSKYIFSLL